MEIGGPTTKFNATLPPKVKYWLHVETSKRSLHRRELTLKPGELRQLKVDLRKDR